MLESFRIVSISNEFPTDEVFEQISISTSKIAKLKKYTVTALHELKDLKVIESKLQILIKQNQPNVVTSLTSTIVSRSKSIFYTETIKN